MVNHTKQSGEFAWIAQVREQFAPLIPPGMEGIGDDCAVIPISGEESMVVTTDMLVEGVHFISSRISPEDLGYKSLAVNLSDIAAMGAMPVASFLSIGFQNHIPERWREGFLNGYESLSTKFNVPLLGGDTTSSDELVVNITVLGKAPNGHIKRRGAANPGDLVCITGKVGDSAAGLKLLLNQTEFSTDVEKLVRSHVYPKPYVEEGRWLGERPGVHAMMDVSDGMASDLVHILRESGVSAEIELSCLPLSEELLSICRLNQWSAEELAVSGGEDYVLLFTLAPQALNAVNKEYRGRFGTNFTVIGKITEGEPEIIWTREGQPVPADWKGFSHF